MEKKSYFSKIEARPNFPQLEKAVGVRWKSEKTFEESVERSQSNPEFILYDGPPFATGSPHYGTIFVSALKDLVGRYKTMRGFYVPRNWGWDCHGLPIETIAEKNLGLTDKAQIETTVGVESFNAECRNIVSTYDTNWREYIDRLGRWVDMEKPYRTLDKSFMESVMWAFSESYKKDLIYKDYRVAPYCYRCETSLSLSEIRVDDSTRPRQDRAITVAFKLKGALEGVSALAWTTTPWTLPSNLALAVGKDVSYVVIDSPEGSYLLAEAQLSRYQRELGKEPAVRVAYSGQQLADMMLEYEPMFPYFGDRKAFRIIIGDFVSTADGTGIVHMAPAFGEDDYWACRANGIDVVNPVDNSGRFCEEVGDFVGRNVHEANPDIIKFLKGEGVVVRDETIEHNYPHCWRCQSPLIYRALDAWYFKIEAIRDRLIQTNEQINWYPSTVKDGRFGKWLENARDWNISRNRYWATPIPVWSCHTCDEQRVYGSADEIEKDGGVVLADLHKEHLDRVIIPCACGGEMHRVPEVLDCWFESGSMPYGQFHYPFENAEHFLEHLPADFIVEYTGQIRCWFYYLHVLSTAIFDKPAFRNCMVHGTLLAADGKKMSKSLKNYTDPLAIMDKFGADSLRGYLFSSPAVGIEDLSFRDEGVESVLKSLILPLWNALSFFTSYAEVDQITPEEISLDGCVLEDLDRYILSEVEIMVRDATRCLDGYRVHEAMRLFPNFLDTLNNWYIRRSRERVWSQESRDASKVSFYATLYDVLKTFAKVLAPFCPFIAEMVWERLGCKQSVHLSSWPDERTEFIDEGLSSEVQIVRQIVSAGLSVRAREKLRVRLPLASAKVAVREDLIGALRSYEGILCGELNVKKIEFLADSSEIAVPQAKVNARLVGPKLGGAMQSVMQKIRAGEFEIIGKDSIKVGDVVLGEGEVELGFVGKEGLAVESASGLVVALDSAVTEELEIEGFARDLIREIQDMRKSANLHIADRIVLGVSGVEAILARHLEYIKSETLCVEVRGEVSNSLVEREIGLGDYTARLSLVRAK